MNNLTSVKEFWKRNPKKRAYYHLKSNAKRRGIYFDISMEYWLKFCDKTNYHILKGRKPENLTIDRIITTRGYIEGNIQAIPLKDNVKKQREFEKATEDFLSNVS